MYKVVVEFAERFDDMHFYKKGDTYPKEGFEPTKERIKELSDGSNKLKTVFIRPLKEYELNIFNKEKLLSIGKDLPIAGTMSNKEIVKVILDSY